MKQRTWTVIVAGLVGALATGTAWAAGEKWYGGLVGCNPYSPADEIYYDEEFGWTTDVPAATLAIADFMCPQPHFFGNNGYSSGKAKVYDSSNDANVTVYLCGTSGADVSASPVFQCSSQTTSGALVGAWTLNFGSQTDSARSYYYWWISLPGDDTNGGGVGDGQSYFQGHYFEDN